MSLRPIEDARRTLNRSVEAVLKLSRLKTNASAAGGRALLESIHRLVRTIDGNLHLDRVRQECESDYERDLGKIVQRRRELLTALRVVRHDAVAAFPVLVGSIQPTAPADRLFSLAKFDSLVGPWLDENVAIDEGNASDEHSGSAGPALILQVVLRDVLPRRGVSADDPELSSLKSRERDLRTQIIRLRRGQFLLERVHPAARWLWVKQVATESNPEVDSVAWHLTDPRVAIQPYKHYSHLLFGDGSVDSEDLLWLEGFRAEVVANTLAVQAEFQSLLGSRAGAAWLLRRYAKRSRCLRLKELRAGLKGARQEREEYLTRDVAMFLFDQGLDVLTEQSRGQHRYDVLGRSLLVEGKVQSKGRSALKAVTEGLKQLHGYQTDLIHEGLQLDPVLVLFRVSGPVADLPPEFTIGNVSVSIVYVDLGQASESGSRASSPERVTEELISALLSRPRKERRRR
jgi:hypothetical protein